ncbi:MAG: hypothetical protein ACOY4I_18130 [Bacillota bacterium]
MRKIYLALVLTLALFLGTAAPGWCGGDVTLKARPGLAGIFKVNQPVAIRVDIENGGEAVKGYLTLVSRNRDMHSRRFEPVYRSEVNVPSGGKTSVEMVVPGEVAANYGSVRLVAGSEVVAETSLEGTGVGGGAVILPLGDIVSGSGLFKWLDRSYGGQVTVKYLPVEELPQRSVFLGVADIVVVGRDSAGLLSAGQLRALKEWVRLGGVLLLSGEAGTAAKGPFADIVPAVRGDVARQALGRGEVILSRTPIEDVNDPEGKYWESLGLSGIVGGQARGRQMELKNIENNILAETGSYLPLVKIPHILVLVLLWIAYTLAVGPGLYLLLKRFNRRDLAWVLIPAVAVVTGLGLYAISPVNRLQSYIGHTLSAVEIVDVNLAEVRTTGTFVVPRGGILDVRGEGESILTPVNIYSHRGRPVSVYGGDVSGVVFSDVEYGSMRQVGSYGIMSGAGSVGGTVYFRNDSVVAGIKNNTIFNLRDCRLLVGPGLLELGDIPAGSEVKISEPLNRTRIITHPGDLYGFAPKSQARAREVRLVSEYTARKSGAGEVYFLGWSDESAGKIKVVKPAGQGQTSGLTLVLQKMEPQFPKGEFKLPVGFIINTVANLGGAHKEGPEGVYVHSGMVKIIYDLQKTLKTSGFRVTAIEFPQIPDRALHTMEIFRHDLSKWDQVGAGKISGEDVMKYVSGEGKVEVRLSPASIEKPGMEGMFRGIAVEGVIGQ